MNHLVALTLFLLVINLSHSQLHPSFAQWKSSVGRNYADSSEEHYRTYIYNKNVQEIKMHNSDPLRTYQQGVNKFTDLTEEQFTLTYLTLTVPSPNPQIQNQNLDDDTEPIVGAYKVTPIDWRFRLNSTIVALLPKVKDQAACGSCWAFAAASTMEFSVAIQFKLIANFSTQQFVSCANSSAGYGNNGCNGGWMPQAFRYATKSNVSDDLQYPYVSGSGTTFPCDNTLRNKGIFNVNSYRTISSRFPSDTLCSPMLERLKIGPYSVALDATPLQRYRRGIYSSRTCGASINHAGIVIGNDARGNWIIQNTWGTSWGQRGYYRFASGNTCGICRFGAMTVTMNK